MCVHVPGVPASRRPAAAAARSRRGVPCQAMPRRMLPHRARAQCVCMCVCVWVCCCPGCCIFPHARAVCAAVYSWGQKTDTFTHTHTHEPCISASSSLQKYTVRVKKPENKIFMVFDPRRVFSASSSLQEYTVRVKKPENKIFKCFDPSRVFQRARACRNIRFGSKNRKTKYSSFLTRAVYFSELELA